MHINNIVRNICCVLSFLLLFLSLYVITHYTGYQISEGFNESNTSCPNLLIKKDNHIYLYDSKRPITPAVNPLIFDSLDEYTEYLAYERSKGRRCPVLELHHTYDTQGKSVYKVYPSPSDKNGGLSLKQAHVQIERNLIDANHNPGNYPGYDDSGFDVGVYTPLDKLFHSKDPISDNAMDTNWGGPEYSRNIVDSGKYRNNMDEIEYRKIRKSALQESKLFSDGSISQAVALENKRHNMSGIQHQ